MRGGPKSEIEFRPTKSIETVKPAERPQPESAVALRERAPPSTRWTRKQAVDRSPDSAFPPQARPRPDVSAIDTAMVGSTKLGPGPLPGDGYVYEVNTGTSLRSCKPFECEPAAKRVTVELR